MKKQTLFLGLFLLLISYRTFSQDMEGSKDHPMFPNRMPNYVIADYSNNFDAVEFNLAAKNRLLTTERKKEKQRTGE